MTAIRIIDDHVQLASIGSKTHAQIESHIQGIGNYAFPAADGGADQVLKTNGAGVLAWIDKNHSIASHNDTSATGAQLDTLVDNSIADALHRHSELVASDGSPDPALKVDAAGKVGIGILSPDNLLHIFAGSAGAVTAHAVSKLVLENNGDLRVQFLTPNTSRTGLRFGDPDLEGQAEFLYNHADDKFEWWYGGAQKMVFVAATGKLGIGIISPATSALVDLTSVIGALLLTRMSTTQRDALTAVNGMLLYNLTLNKFQGYENGAWTSFI